MPAPAGWRAPPSLEMMASSSTRLVGQGLRTTSTEVLPLGPGHPNALLRAGGYALLIGPSGAHRPLSEGATVETSPGALGTAEPVPGSNGYLRALAEREGLREGDAIDLPPPPASAHARLETGCTPEVAAWLGRIALLRPVLHDRQGHLSLELLCGQGPAFAHLLPRRPTPFRRPRRSLPCATPSSCS